MKLREHEMQGIWNTAWQAGLRAGKEAAPTPMVVQAHENPLDDNSRVTKQWHVPEGVCGFAWVKVKPATTRFARWLKREGHASKAYGGGYSIWISAHGQSYERKLAHAQAMAKVFNHYGDVLGNEFYAGGRLD